jgi:hypothetical protein
LVLLAVGGALLATGSSAAAAPSGGPQLIVDRDFPDPGVVQTAEDGDYVYSSDGYYAGKLINVPEAHADSLTGPWTATGVDALPVLPSWVSFDPSSNTDDVWAPDVSRLDDGGYILYYVAHDTDGLQCIGAATAATPVGPFALVGDQPLICGTSDYGDIDPMAYTDNGKHYLLYKDNANSANIPDSIWINQVGSDGVSWIGGRTKMLTADAGGNENNVAEAPDVVKHNGEYVLFYSADNWNSTYHMKYAVSTTLVGAYAKQGTFADTASFGGTIPAPGGDYAVTAPDGTQYLFFHGNIAGGRGLYLDQLTWPHNVPTLAGSAGLVAGTYQFTPPGDGTTLAERGSDRWVVTRQGNGSYRIVSASSHLALTALSWGGRSSLALLPSTGRPGQAWDVARDFDGYFRITAASTGQLLTSSGNTPTLTANTDAANQKWLPTES